MALPDHKKQFLNAVGFDATEIAAVEEVMANKSRLAQDEGLHSREQQQPVVVVNTAPQTVPAQEPQPQQQPVVDQEAQLKQAQEFIVKALEPYLAPLSARLMAIEADLTALKQATAASPAASSIINKEGDHVIAGRSDKGPKENNSDKEQTVKVTGVPFIDNLISLNQHAVDQQYQVGG